MRIRKGIFVLLAALCLCVFAGAEEFDGYVVKLREQKDTMATLSISEQTLLEPMENLPQTYLVKSAEDVEKLRATGLVEYAEPNYILECLEAPNDPYYSSQWTLPAIGYDALWGTQYDGTGVTVAVIDSGLDTTHEDFEKVKISPYSKNFLGNGSHPEDYFRDQKGHGTFVTSQIASVTNNGIGLSGTLWNTEIMVLRCVSGSGSDKYPYDKVYDEGSGSATKVAEAMRYAADNGAHVINISLGIRSASQTLQEAVDYAHSKGVVVVAAAGNDGNSTPFYPASGEHVISVGSVSRSGSTLAKSWFSQYNAYVDVTAPGGDVMGVDVYPFSSTEWYTEAADTYRTDGGTSYSSPVTAALVGVCKQVDEKLDAEDIQSLLAATSVDYGTAGYDTYYGYGVVNAENLLTALTRTEYAIVYDLGANDAVLPEGGTDSYRLNRTADLVLPIPVREGYTFLGWYESEALEGQAVSVLPKGTLGMAEAVTENGKVTGYAIGAVTLYAAWQANSAVLPKTVEYDLYAGGSLCLELSLRGNTLVDVLAQGQSLTGDDYTVSNNVLTLSENWLSALPQGQTELTFRFSAGSDAKVLLTVKDTAPLYTVTFYLRTTDGAAYAVKQIRGTVLGTLPQEPSRSGYRFTGWYLADGSTRVTARTTLTGDTGVYAAWVSLQQPEPPALTVRVGKLELIFAAENAASASATFGGESRTLQRQENVFTLTLAAKEMLCPAEVDLFDANGTQIACWQGTYADAARKQLNDALAAEDAQTVVALTAALELGAAAQQHFGFDADNLPNWGMDIARQQLDAYKAQLDAVRKDESSCTEPEVILGSSLLLEDQLKMKLYFSLSDGMTATVNGETVTGSEHIVTLTDVSAPVQITVKQNGKVICEGIDSAASYCARLQVAGYSALSDAILLYGMTNL